MNGHVKGPLVMGQKVRVTLDGSIERSDGAWEVFCGGYMLPLDLDGIVSIEFLGDPPPLSDVLNVCPAEAPSGVHCWKVEGHNGSHVHRGATW
jgi:hypothetical protein